MKRVIPIGLSILAVSAVAFAQSSPDADKILAAAPPNMQKDATVIKWKSDFTYDTLKKGTNKMVCYDLSGFPTHPPYMLECTSTANLDRVAQNLKLEAIQSLGLLGANQGDAIGHANLGFGGSANALPPAIY